MRILNIIICALVLCYIEHAYGFKECNDCVIITSCPNALKVARNNKTEASKKKLLESFCRTIIFEIVRDVNNGFAMVCCSDFTDSVEHFETTATESAIEEHRNVNLLPTSCGDIDGHRIIGGSNARLNEFPWMALVGSATRNGPEYTCVGTIINSKYILTAGHCVADKKVLEVRIGEYDRRGERICQDRLEIACESDLQNIAVEKVTLHPNFRERKQNDIALLRLRSSINLEFKNAQPICLPVTQKLRNVSLANKTATIAGWGQTEYNHYSNVLLKAEISIHTHKECAILTSSRSFEDENDSKEFCAGGNQVDSCKGDSGGPVMLEGLYNGLERYIQYGIVSTGPRICGTDPGIYTDVTKYMEWILDNIKP